MTCRSSTYIYLAICAYVDVISITQSALICHIRHYGLPDYTLTHSAIYFIEVVAAIRELSSSGYPCAKPLNIAFRHDTVRGWDHSWLIQDILQLSELWVQRTE